MYSKYPTVISRIVLKQIKLTHLGKISGILSDEFRKIWKKCSWSNRGITSSFA
jgi:hypothetical protein